MGCCAWGRRHPPPPCQSLGASATTSSVGSGATQAYKQLSQRPRDRYLNTVLGAALFGLEHSLAQCGHTHWDTDDSPGRSVTHRAGQTLPHRHTGGMANCWRLGTRRLAHPPSATRGLMCFVVHLRQQTEEYAALSHAFPEHSNGKAQQKNASGPGRKPYSDSRGSDFGRLSVSGDV